MKKRVKKIVAVLAVFTLTIGMLTGCSSKEKEKKNTVQGRYVETEIELPKEGGDPIGLIMSEGNPVLYMQSSETGECNSYTYKQGSWSKQHPENWLKEESVGSIQVEKIIAGADGAVYAKANRIVNGSQKGQALFQKNSEDQAVDVTPEDIVKRQANGETFLTVDADVLNDEVLAFAETPNDMVRIYKEGKCIKELKDIMEVFSEEQEMMAVGKDTFAVIGEDGKSIDFYDITNFEKKNTVQVDMNLENCTLMAGESGKWYVENQLGIHRILEDGSIVETILNGSSTMLNHGSWFAKKFVVDDNEQFYGLFSNQGKWKMMQYIYDSKAMAVQETLSVYSLEESETVNQAVYEFQKKNPNVKVEHKTAVSGEDKADTEDIRTLNTELLGGKGADVLILDGLPIESYIEKGVLSDISSFANALKEQGALKNVIENTAEKDGKIYGVPARINVPVLYGTEEEVKALESLKNLSAYAERYKDRQLFGYDTYELSGMTLFNFFYDEIVNQDGSLNEEKLTELLSIWQKICHNGNLPEYEERYGGGPSVWAESDWNFQSAQEVDSPSLKKFVHLTEISGLSYTRMIYNGVEKAKMLPESIKGYYVPKLTVGINTSSEQKELAEEFISCMFLEDVQEMDTWEGFPIKEQALDGLVDSLKKEKDSMGFSGIDYGTGKEYQVDMKYPEVKEMESLIALIKTLDTPFSQDKIISDIVLSELEHCYEGKQSPQETAQAICEKAGTYLTE